MKVYIRNGVDKDTRNYMVFYPHFYMHKSGNVSFNNYNMSLKFML